MARELRDAVDEELTRLRAENIEVQADRLVVGGFPHRLGMDGDGVAVRAADGTVVILGDVVADAAVWDPTLLELRSETNGSFALGPIIGGPTAWRGTYADLTGQLRPQTEPNALPRDLQVVLDVLEVVGRTDEDTTRIERVEISAEQPSGAFAQRVTLSMSDVALPIDLMGSDGIDGVHVDLTTDAPFPVSRREPLVRAWQASNGTAELSAEIRMAAGRSISASGRIQLDSGLQPAASLTLTISDAPALLQEAQAEGLIDPIMAGGIRLYAQSSNPAAWSEGRVELPITIANGSMQVGPVPIGQVGTVVWPQ